MNAITLNSFFVFSFLDLLNDKGFSNNDFSKLRMILTENITLAVGTIPKCSYD